MNSPPTDSRNDPPVATLGLVALGLDWSNRSRPSIVGTFVKEAVDELLRNAGGCTRLSAQPRTVGDLLRESAEPQLGQPESRSQEQIGLVMVGNIAVEDSGSASCLRPDPPRLRTLPPSPAAYDVSSTVTSAQASVVRLLVDAGDDFVTDWQLQA